MFSFDEQFYSTKLFYNLYVLYNARFYYVIVILLYGIRNADLYNTDSSGYPFN